MITPRIKCTSQQKRIKRKSMEQPQRRESEEEDSGDDERLIIKREAGRQLIDNRNVKKLM